MKTNLIKALTNLVSSNQFQLAQNLTSSNRITLQGKALEEFVKDMFCGTFGMSDEAEKLRIYSKKLSWQWSANYPPDLILRDGDAIEVKKIGNAGSISLNSSYPKDKIYADSTMILPACRNCEDWISKDIIYAIGVVKDEAILSLWLVYGACFAASKDTYDRTFHTVTNLLTLNSHLEFSPTNELWRVNSVDPLGITYLRIRGMWWVEHPNKIFDYLPLLKGSTFTVNALMLKEKYISFPAEDREILQKTGDDSVQILEVEIKSPNNPVNLLEAVLITLKK
jgi:NgoPII restriction endonuclease